MRSLSHKRADKRLSRRDYSKPFFSDKIKAVYYIFKGYGVMFNFAMKEPPVLIESKTKHDRVWLMNCELNSGGKVKSSGYSYQLTEKETRKYMARRKRLRTI